MHAPSSKKPKRPRDINQLAYQIVREATGEHGPGVLAVLDAADRPQVKNPAAVALGKLGGAKGGRARAEKLTPQRRQEIAKKAAAARWKKPSSQE
jgi:hypothetical protein